ncbi:MAG: hypothetical protein GXP62_21435 [Oligoflexia bacterium]|nr:hypothetical protein [Oligoflexia bacterium]
MIQHIFRQGPAIGATLSLLMTRRGQTAPQVPGPLLTQTVPARSRALVDDYLRVVGGDPKRWRGRLPPHMFPQWGWPIITRALRGLPYDLTKVVNAGCTWTVNQPLPDDQPLVLSARLAHLDDDGRRVLFRVELSTGTALVPDAVQSSLTVFCPLPRKKEAEPRQKARKKPSPTVPTDAIAIGQRRLPATQGWRFALVTGDINPIHWVGPYARLAGFGGVILHGFATAAIAAERVIGDRLSGDIDRLTCFKARFPRPLRLPGTATIFLGSPKTDGEDGATPLFVGTAPGGPATLVGDIHV